MTSWLFLLLVFGMAFAPAGRATAESLQTTCGVGVTLIRVNEQQEPTVLRVDDTFQVAAYVSSACQLQSVVATVFGRTTSLTFNSSQGRWTGTPSIVGAPVGPGTLTVVATDVFGTSGSRSVTIVHDKLPVLTVTRPTPGTVGRPKLRLEAACSDDGPQPCTIIVRAGPYPWSGIVASGTGQLQADVWLDSLDGQHLPLAFYATDSGGFTTQVLRDVFVDMNPRLVEAASVPGFALDYQAGRVLFHDTRPPVLNRERMPGSIKLFDAASGETRQVSPTYGVPQGTAFLTPIGALFQSYDNDWGSLLLYEWRNGTLLRQGGFPAPQVVGRYAIHHSSEFSGWPLVRRDLVAGTTVTIGQNAHGPDLAPNGDVVFGRTYDGIYRFRDGVTTRLATSSFGNLPVTDGVNVAYIFSGGVGVYQTWLLTQSGEVPLASFPLNWDPSRYSGDRLTQRLDYEVAGGWTAFTRPTTSANLGSNVFVRSPAGVETQVTFYGDRRAVVEVLNDDGRFTFIVRAAAASDVPKRYLYENGTVTYLGNADASTRSMWIDGELFLLLGGSVFRVTRCSFSVSPTSANFGPSGGSGSITVTTTPGCTWTSDSGHADLTITSGSSVSGSGTLTYSVAANNSTAPRTLPLVVAGELVSVTQGYCPWSVSPTMLRVPPGGATHTITVATDAGCGWIATTSAGWITFPSGRTGSGPGTLMIAVDVNTAAFREATVTVGSATITLAQPGSSRPYIVLDAPLAGPVATRFTVAGWAIDLGGEQGGISAVDVWAFPESGGTPVFLGQTVPSLARPDIEALYGPAFRLTGFDLRVTTLTPGRYTLVAYGFSRVTSTFAASAAVSVEVRVNTAPDPHMAIDAPPSGATLQQPFVLAGWALDAGAAAGTGVDAIHVWAYPGGSTATGVPRFVGSARLGIPRPDIAALFGEPFRASGYDITVTGLPPGEYQLVVFARSTVTITFNQARVTTVRIGSGVRMFIDAPAPYATVAQPFRVAGWAVDLAATEGTGVDTVHVWAYPTDGRPAFFVGVASYGIARPDIASLFGPPFANSGYTVIANGLASGTYDLVVFPHSSVSGRFDQSGVVRISVP